MIRPLWIEINLKSLGSNLKLIKRYIEPKTKIMATVKQSAYGHGLIPIVRELTGLGVNFFGVGSLEEAISLREAKVKEPILVLSSVFGQFAEYFIKHKVRPTIVDVNFAKKLNKAAEKREIIFPVHLKVDTGMGRLGLYYRDAYKFIREVKRLKNICLEGIFTHFPVADSDPDFTDHQIDIFNKFVVKLKNERIHFKYQHCANSIGIIKYPHSHFNMIRPGLILYGVKPSFNIDLEAEPVLSLKSKIIFLKKIKKGMGVSYGRTYIARGSTIIATAAMGYADGYPWALSSCGKAIIRGSLFNLAGRVCMDHIMLDLKKRTDIKVGEEVVLIGSSKKTSLRVEDLALAAGTIPYEILTRLSLKIPRCYKFSSLA